MKKRRLLLASVLVFSMGISALTWAEEAPTQPGEGLGGLLDSLFSDGGVVEKLLDESGVVSSLAGGREALSSLFEEDGVLSGILPENVDIDSVLQSLGSQLEGAGSTLYDGIQSVAELVAKEGGSIDWSQLGSSAGELIDLITGGAMTGNAGGEDETELSEEDLEAIIAEIMIPYKKADAVMFDYVAERNAELMDAGDAQVFSKRTGYSDDIELDEVKVLGDFTQVNYAIDGDQMNMVGAATDTLLLTLTKGEDDNFTVTDEKHTEDGEGYTASLEALCEEVGITVDDFYAHSALGAYNDATALAEYLEEHPEIATAQFQGEQMTAEELRKLADDYNDNLFDSLFEETEAEDMTEAER